MLQITFLDYRFCIIENTRLFPIICDNSVHDPVVSMAKEPVEHPALADTSPAWRDLLTSGALDFIARLERTFGARRRELLRQRLEIQARIDAGILPGFLDETKSVREGEWKIAPVPADLRDRRVEITGPAGDKKMVINALNSGANVFMADFEDAQSPTWHNTLQGQRNLSEAIRGTISYQSPEGKAYRLNDRVSTLMVRPRGWHLEEKHCQVDGSPVSASLFDFGLFFYHNAGALIDKGTGPFFYLPKMENRLEARLWNDVFLFSESELGIPRGTIKATALIETILAAFEMDEILFELRDHSAGLNCGRWDYIFSYIKKFHSHGKFVLPERASLTMEKGFLQSYVTLLIKTCHRRGAHAMGGMAAQIPIRNNPEASAAAEAKVRADKLREVKAGHDGTWVAHPGLVALAKEVFDRSMEGLNQIGVIPEEEPGDLLEPIPGEITRKGVLTNINVGIRYIAAWLSGTGAVPLYHLMEDAATAEICRAQIWQWIRHGARVDGRPLTREAVIGMIEETGPQGCERATNIFKELVTDDEFCDFLTIKAYPFL